jgi:hypothetical protein
MAHVVLTGPVRRVFTMSDGTVYDATPDFVEVASDEHAAELADLIGKHYEENGHPSHDADKPFRYIAAKRKKD